MTEERVKRLRVLGHSVNYVSAQEEFYPAAPEEFYPAAPIAFTSRTCTL